MTEMKAKERAGGSWKRVLNNRFFGKTMMLHTE